MAKITFTDRYTGPNTVDAVCQDIRDRISSGAWEADDQLPTQVKMRSYYGIDSEKMYQVAKQLKSEDRIIVLTHRHGTFVQPADTSWPRSNKDTLVTKSPIIVVAEETTAHNLKPCTWETDDVVCGEVSDGYIFKAVPLCKTHRRIVWTHLEIIKSQIVAELYSEGLEGHSSGNTYIIGPFDGYVKIGHVKSTGRLSKRWQELQGELGTFTVLAVLDGGQTKERLIHDIFMEERKLDAQEQFKYDRAIRTFVAIHGVDKSEEVQKQVADFKSWQSGQHQ